LNLTSIKNRFLASIGVNILRAIISFLTGLLVARGLSPSGYGDLYYLLGSFLAVKALMDMGSGSAFYTFISQRSRGRNFYLMYYSWLLIQFVVSTLLVVVLMPQPMIDRIWFGHSRDIILLAFFASFMQQQIWTTVVQLGESTRQTVKVQLLGLSVIVTHSIVMLILYFNHWLSITAVLLAIFAEYFLATIASSKLLFSSSLSEEKVSDDSVKVVLGEYWKYCRPLILLAVVSFLYEFADRWLLQKFGGSTQQGFYQISAQLAAICLLATTSILNIFWKEISEANDRQDQARLAFLYHKVNRGLLMVGAIISCFMVPWAKEIVTFLLGNAYKESWAIFAIMLLYPIHQSMGQVNATMFLACSRTKAYSAISIIGQVISIPVSYILIASSEDILIPGLELGAFGLAIKMVVLNILLVNIQALMIARFNGWKYEWKYQVFGITSVLALSYSVKYMISFLFPTLALSTDNLSLIILFLSSGVIYLIGVAVILWVYPQVAGLEKRELQTFLNKVNPFKAGISN
jgi:O-antigen/teichoic acid export membrane protein